MAAGNWEPVADSLSRALERSVRVERAQALGGGSINQGLRLDTDAGPFFLKLNAASRVQMFEAEAEGLMELASAGAVRVPRPVAWGADATRAWLVLEYLPLGSATDATQRELGRRLAALHRCTATDFGWTRDNTIGSTPQHNARGNDWLRFWRERRLRVQFELAARNGYTGRLQETGARLLDRLGVFFRSYSPVPSLLHGDLWSGNAGVTEDGEPVIFDPAVYYGDRETDLAMTELFGGFSAAFYAGYAQAFPLDAGYAGRRDLYNLYHVLNHLNLFGGGYLGQAQRMIDRLLQFD
jgi:fructosamine-3-kinase